MGKVCFCDHCNCAFEVEDNENLRRRLEEIKEHENMLLLVPCLRCGEVAELDNRNYDTIPGRLKYKTSL